MFKTSITFLLTFFSYSALAQNTIDTFHLYFDLNIATLNKNTAKKIDLLIYNDKIINGSSLMVIGYADFLGSEGYNKNLSMQRAENIKKYLVQYGINPADIKMCVGKGEIERKEMTDKEGSPSDRKVDIVVNNKITRSEIGYRSTKTTPSGHSDIAKNGDKTKTPTSKTSKSDTGKKRGADIVGLTKMKEGQTIRLNNVYFPPGSHVMKPESFETLEKLYSILKENPALKISIEGHVCCVHDVPDADDIDTGEPVLSVNRAKAIYAYLVGKGIDTGRLQYVGYGKKFPIVPFERTEDDADKNRRVEIRIVSN